MQEAAEAPPGAGELVEQRASVQRLDVPEHVLLADVTRPRSGNLPGPGFLHSPRVQ
jgi:hypothetical protein